MTADSLVGASPGNRPNRAWVDVYRGLAHGVAKEACKAARNVDFPDSVRACADSFVRLQDARHTADYDPESRFLKEEALAAYEEARTAIETLAQVPARDRKAFAAWVLVSSPGTKQGRKARRQP